jgi:hypothetical protein
MFPVLDSFILVIHLKGIVVGKLDDLDGVTPPQTEDTTRYTLLCKPQEFRQSAHPRVWLLRWMNVALV